MSSTKNTLCDACGKSLPGKGSLTQWIGLDVCKCAIAGARPADNARPLDKRDEVCLSCGKNRASNTGSITQWVFRSSLCKCQPAPAPIVSDTNNPAQVLLSEPAADVLLGHHYQVIDSLGTGGMSEVYKARHQFLGTTVAIKVLSKERAADTKTLMRFQQEARSVSRLEHPNIVKLREFGVDDEKRPFLVMDYVDGKSLNDVIEEEGALRPTRAVKILQKIADALSHAHCRGVIHRDLKPNNIIMFSDENGENIKVVDFGIAKVSETEGDNRDLTQTGEIFGSPYYMSPEQCKGQKLDERSDIYSFGCLIYELLTGEPAAKAQSVVETLMIHVTGFTPNFSDSEAFKRINEAANVQPSEGKRELTAWHGLAQVARSCLKLDRESRYASMESIKKELDLIGGGNLPRGPRQNLIDTSALSTRLSGLLSSEKGTNQGRRLNAKEGLALLAIASGLVVLTATIMGSFNASPPPPASSSTRKSNDDAGMNISALVDPTLGEHSRYILAGDGKEKVQVRCELTPEAIKRLSTMKITSLAIRSAHVLDSDLLLLGTLAGIDTVDLSGSFGFSEQGILSLNKLPRLKTLDLSGAEVGLEHVRALKSLPLESLDLAYTTIGDDCIEELNSSRTLERLSIQLTNVSRKGDRELVEWGWKKRGRFYLRGKSLTSALVSDQYQSQPNQKNRNTKSWHRLLPVK